MVSEIIVTTYIIMVTLLDSMATCLNVTESRFCIFYLQYLNGTKSNEGKIFRLYISQAALYILKVSLDSKLLW
jgi:hypothetical protein